VLFKLGKVVTTPAALELLEREGVSPAELLRKHASGDWGELDVYNERENEICVEQGCRVRSSYPVGSNGARAWIITEANRSSTMILRPDEY
jgi:hypothetical protein